MNFRIMTRSAEERGIISRSAPITPKTLDKDKRSVTVVASSEKPVLVRDWDRGIIREILLSDGAVLPERVPLLDSHDASTVSSILGSARGFAQKSGTIESEISFSDTDEGRSAFRKMEEGHLTDVSVGYRTFEDGSVWVPENERTVINGREFTGPVMIRTKWELMELSVTPIGADSNAKARAGQPSANRAEKNSGGTMKITQALFNLLISRGLIAQGSPMEQAETVFSKLPVDEQRALIAESEKPPVTPPTPQTQLPANQPSVADQIRVAVEAERVRSSEIRQVCIIAKMPEKAEDLIARGVSVDEARKIIFVEMAKRPENTPPQPHVTVTADESDKFRAAVSDGLASRAVSKIDKPAPGFEAFRGKRLLRIAEECLQRAGIKTGSMSDSDIARRAFANSSADFPLILARTAGKVLRAAYDEQPSTYEAFVKIVDAIDFKAMDRLQFSESPDLELINEGAEYKEGKFTEAKESYQVQKFGKMFSVTWEAVVNDDLAALTRIPAMFGAASRRKINDIVYAILTDNAAMADSVNLFDAAHSNLAGSGAAISSTSLGAARAAMRKQKGILNKAILNITPRYLIIPAELETAAEVMLRSLSDPAASGNSGVTNPFQNKLMPVVDARLSANSATAWYLAADPNQIDTIEVAFLDGQRAPYLEEEPGFEVDGRRYKVRMVFGAKAIDHRGLYKNPGA